MELNPNLDTNNPELVCWERFVEGGRTRLINRDVLFKNLVEIHKVLDTNGIKHWLSHGTMLGAYREGNFIAWDDDADIGLDFTQRGSKEFAKAMRSLIKRGYWVPPSDPDQPIGKDNAPYYDLVAIKDGEKVEGWFFEKFGDNYIYDKPRCGNQLTHSTKYYDTLVDFDFRGEIFKIPNHIEDWLVMMYGESWKTPDRNKKYNTQA